ncbi:glycosyl hydrolase catalytic core-domain-containing protein [Ampelomyces quisqualis]|uniref:Glycosyl hydrolase catalytic core-domain-containing protein n=1 Tax=Ampelomyces quisqualis TaxID=50730 RepID=A0A6A5QN20_AMPQU|nr:glycosyl hydrolase catalytic core-domain-containing protein [Ampelomyces quisqualis]
MPSMKISLLALASAVAAVPHYGAHSKFHNRMRPTGAYGGDKPYPTGGWGGYNSTRVPSPTGGDYEGGDKTNELTTTSTTTVLKTVVIKPSDAPSGVKVTVENITPGSGDKCGPATITVTATDKVTVTVTPGGGADIPKSSAVASKSDGYGAPPVLASPTPKGEQTPAVPVVNSKTSKAPEKSSSAVPENQISSVIEQPVATLVQPSAAPSKTPSGSGNSYSGSKRGLAYNEASLCKSFGSNFGFGYNWGQVENNDIGTNFIPMMHGPSKATSQEWLANVDKAVKKGSKAVMGFNEPDHAEQANLSPAAACAAWKEYMNPIASAHPELTIIGPSVTNGPAPMGIAWLSNFHDQCPDAIVHATNIHFYDIYESATIDRFKAQVEKAAEIYGKPVWITEFGLNPGSASQEQAASFLKEAMAYLDASDKVQGYSWFMVGGGENQLMSGNALSAVGKVYASH